MLHTRGFVPYRGWGPEVVFAGTLSRYPSDRDLLGACSMRHSEVNVGVNLFSSVRLEIGV